MQKEIKIYNSTLKNFDYEMLDTGGGEKLERFGAYTFVRPLEEATWNKTLDKKVWDSADGRFVSSKNREDSVGWKINKKVPKDWVMNWKDIKFKASPTPFRHLSFFPEQASHWEFIYKKLVETFAQENNSSTLLHPSGGTFRHQNSSPAQTPKFLNLFGYTGVASLVALSAGAEVTHVDASKQSVELAKENQKLSGLEDKPMRVIVDDVIKFLEREVKRGNKYDAVIMDPPKHGRGPKGETWEINKDLPRLISLVQRVLSQKPIFVILTSYSTDASSLSLGYALENIQKEKGGSIQAGEMCIKETSSGKLISLAHTAVWEN